MKYSLCGTTQEQLACRGPSLDHCGESQKVLLWHLQQSCSSLVSQLPGSHENPRSDERKQ